MMQFVKFLFENTLDISTLNSTDKKVYFALKFNDEFIYSLHAYVCFWLKKDYPTSVECFVRYYTRCTRNECDNFSSL